MVDSAKLLVTPLHNWYYIYRHYLWPRILRQYLLLLYYAILQTYFFFCYKTISNRLNVHWIRDYGFYYIQLWNRGRHNWVLKVHLQILSVIGAKPVLLKDLLYVHITSSTLRFSKLPLALHMDTTTFNVPASCNRFVYPIGPLVLNPNYHARGLI